MDVLLSLAAVLAPDIEVLYPGAGDLEHGDRGTGRSRFLRIHIKKAILRPVVYR